MNTSGRLADLTGSEAWETVADPRVIFCCDDGRNISFPQHYLGKADEFGGVLLIEIGKGKVEIAGPKVKELHRDFCRGKATMIKSDGLDILSVRMVP